MKRASCRGFTIVEVLIVIVIIAILAIISATTYINVQVQARDAKLADAADKVADAIELFISKNGHFPAGGAGATGAISGSECGSGSNGWFATGASMCTVEDTLVASGYLTSSLSSNLPVVVGTTNKGIMVYTLGNSGTTIPTYYAMVYFSMESPTSNDANNFQTQLTKCGVITAPASTPQYSQGMRNGICIQYSL